jgi:acyl-CoA reductase-like NAD-dependent aldehyde dehydrogenase
VHLYLHVSGSIWSIYAVQALGNYIGGEFVSPSGTALVSRNPATEGSVVFETGFTVGAVDDAAKAAAAAQPNWAALSLAERNAHLDRFKAELASRADQLADAIVLETGKIRSSIGSISYVARWPAI